MPVERETSYRMSNKF